MIPWSELARAREEVRRRWPSVFHLPVVPRRFPFLASFLREDSRLLEVGAAERPFDDRLKRDFPGVVHRTLDIDPAGGHDFRSLEEAAASKQAFDLIVAWEVIEHLPLEAIPGWLAGLRKVAVPGGKLILSTPNVFRPGQYHLDCTHRTPLAWQELGALVLMAGFELESMHRTRHRSAAESVLGLALDPLRRALGVDDARSVVAVARVPHP